MDEIEYMAEIIALEQTIAELRGLLADVLDRAADEGFRRVNGLCDALLGDIDTALAKAKELQHG